MLFLTYFCIFNNYEKSESTFYWIYSDTRKATMVGPEIKGQKILKTRKLL